MAVDGRDGCGRPRTTVAAVDGNEQLLTAVDGSDGCGRMPTAVDRRGRPSMAMMLADSVGLRWRDAQGRGQVQEWRLDPGTHVEAVGILQREIHPDGQRATPRHPPTRLCLTADRATPLLLGSPLPAEAGG